MTARVPVFRLLGGPDHFYTIGEDERDNAVAQYGYHVEGIAFYAYATAEDPGPAPLSVRDQLAAAIIGHLVGEAARATRSSRLDTSVKAMADYAAKMAYSVAATSYLYADAMLAARDA